MKKRIAIIITLVVFLLVISASSIYAWYINQERTEVLNPSTNGVVFSYTIDDEEIVTDTFDIKDVAFFDIDSEYEGKYLTDMAVIVTFKVTNKSSRAININFSYLLPDELNNPYIACIFSITNELDSTNAEGSIEDYLSNNNLSASAQIEDVAKDETITAYAYIYGIQPNDAANNDFLSDTYTITFEIEGLQR